MSQPRPRTGRINNHARRLALGLVALGACCAATAGCASYGAERAQYESHHVTLRPAASGATFSGGQMTASVGGN